MEGKMELKCEVCEYHCSCKEEMGDCPYQKPEYKLEPKQNSKMELVHQNYVWWQKKDVLDEINAIKAQFPQWAKEQGWVQLDEDQQTPKGE